MFTCIAMLALPEYSLETDDSFKMHGARGLEVVLVHILRLFLCYSSQCFANIHEKASDKCKRFRYSATLANFLN